MTRRSRVGNPPPSIGRGRTNRTTARGIRRRLARLAFVCAPPLLAYLVSDFAPPQRASAQVTAQQEVVLTGYHPPCKTDYHLAVVSLTTTLQEEQLPASSLGLVFIRGGNRPNRIFSIYRFGSGPSAITKRDDDQGGPGLITYKPGEIGTNFKNFLKAATGCDDTEDLAAAMAGALKPAAGDGNAAPPLSTASEFTRAVGETFRGLGNLSLSQQQPPPGAAEGEKEFGETVRQYGDDLRIFDGELVSANREQLLNRVKGLSPRPEPTTSPEAKPTVPSEAKGGDRLNLYVTTFLALAASALTAYFNRRRIVPLLERWGLAGGRPTPADTAAELVDILSKSRRSFQQVQARTDFMRHEVKRLCSEISNFRKCYQPLHPSQLELIVRTFSNELALTANDKNHKPQDLYNRLWEQLDEYQKKHYPIGAAQNAGTQIAPGGPQTDETKPDETTTPAVVEHAAGLATPAAIVTLDESSLKAIEDRIAPLIESLRGESGGHQQVEELWRVWFGERRPPGGDAFRQVLKRTADAKAVFEVLHDNFPHDDSGRTDVRARLRGFFDELRHLKNNYINGRDGEPKTPDKILAAFKTKLDDGQREHAELDKLSQAIENTGRVMRPVLNNGEKVLEAAQRLAREQKEILNLLTDYREGGGLGAEGAVRNLFSAAEALKARVIRARQTMSAALRAEVDIGDVVDEMAARVVEELQRAKQLAERATQLQQERDDFKSRVEQAEPEAAAAKELAVAVARRLNFHAGRVESEERPALFMVEELEKQPPIYDQLRYMLLASRSMLDEALPALHRSGREDIAEALRLEGVRKNLADFTWSLHGITPDKLWELGVCRAFSDSWLHDLFRSSVLLRTYFSGAGELYQLRRGVELAAAVFEVAMHHLGARLVTVTLLENPPGGVEEEKNALPSLRVLPEVKNKVVEHYRAVQGGGFVVDVGAFTVRVNGAVMGAGRVFIMNPADWD